MPLDPEVGHDVYVVACMYCLFCMYSYYMCVSGT